jgi:propanol-preferring alcohol dehydrogenase
MRLQSYGSPLRMEEVERPEAGLGAVVRVEAAGVCHTDLHIASGSYNLGEGRQLTMSERGIRLPLTLGHEISGTVVDPGATGSTAFRRGDRVVVYPWLGCGTCRKCAAGFENLCEVKPASLGIFRDGGYAEFVRVPDTRYLVDASGLEPGQAATMACSGLTAFSALKKCELADDDLLVITGAGGLGTTALQLAKKTRARVGVLDVVPSKLEVASELGADFTLDTSSMGRDDVVEGIKRRNGGRGADAVLDFVGSPTTTRTGFEMLTKQGRLIVVGLFGGAGSFSLPLFPLRGAQVRGSFTGTLPELAELVGMARSGGFRQVISAEYALGGANDALSELGEGRISGRAVLRP